MSDNTLNNSVERFGYEQTLRRVLPISALVFYGLAFINPIGAFTLYGVTQQMTHGMFTLAFTIAAGSMIFTAYSYSRMAAVYPIAGSAYSFAQRSIHPYVGFYVGWSYILDYILVPITNYLLLGLYLNSMFPMIPKWAIILFFVVAIHIINVVGIKIAANANTGLLIIQFVFIAAIIIFMLKFLLTGNGAATLVSADAFINSAELNNPEVGWPTIFTAASVLCLCFTGFDAITTLSEEAINPEKNVGKAIIIACLIVSVLFIGLAYLSTLCWPQAWSELKSPDTGAVELIGIVAGSAMAYLFSAIFCVGCLASGIASQSSGARLLFGMGRDGVLPKFFAHVNPKFQTPTTSLAIIAVIGLSAIFFDIFSIASLINFGALLAFASVNISVIGHYYIRGKQRSGANVLKNLIVPLIGAAITLGIWFNLDKNALIMGGTWTVIGTIYLMYQTKMFKQLPIEMKLDE